MDWFYLLPTEVQLLLLALSCTAVYFTCLLLPGFLRDTREARERYLIAESHRPPKTSLPWLHDLHPLPSPPEERVEAPEAPQDHALLQRWRSFQEEEETLLKRWLSYERDLSLRIQYPFMRDYTEPEVVAVVKAMNQTTMRRGDTPPPPSFTGDLASLPYPQAVILLREALLLAESRARQVGRTDFSTEDRSRLREAERILAMAKNDASSPAERRLCYERVVHILETLEKPILVDPEVLTGVLEASGLLPAIEAA